MAFKHVQKPRIGTSVIGRRFGVSAQLGMAVLWLAACCLSAAEASGGVILAPESMGTAADVVAATVPAPHSPPLAYRVFDSSPGDALPFGGGATSSGLAGPSAAPAVLPEVCMDPLLDCSWREIEERALELPPSPLWKLLRPPRRVA